MKTIRIAEEKDKYETKNLDKTQNAISDVARRIYTDKNKGKNADRSTLQ